MAIRRTTPINRTRRFIIRLLAAGLVANHIKPLAVHATASHADQAETNVDTRPMDDELAQLFGNLCAAKAVGRAYLQAQSAPNPTLTSLRAEVVRVLRSSEKSLGSRFREPLSVRLRSQIRQDFAAGNVAIVDGWMLSRTEAQACAIAYLTAIQ